MAKYKTAGVVVARAIVDEAKTSEALADELGMTRRYVNRVLASLRAERRIYVESWYVVERQRSGPFYAQQWRLGRRGDAPIPHSSKKQRDAKARARMRERLEHERFNAAAHAVVDPGRFVIARALLLRLVADEALTVGELAAALGYTVQHAARVIRYLKARREVFVERWTDTGVAVWRAGRKYNARKNK